MRAGLPMCIAGAISFGLLACVSKLAERRRCNPSALVVWLFAWAAMIMLVRSLTLSNRVPLTWPVSAIAVVFGICAAVAYLAFQRSIEFGNITVGWLVMNLSAGVPALVSIWLYSEKLSALKIVAFGLALLSLFCLFQGNRLEAGEKTAAQKADS
jgi:drug/metabolite transporter (DMT)-like permease